jgi:hypothetical protein
MLADERLGARDGSLSPSAGDTRTTPPVHLMLPIDAIHWAGVAAASTAFNQASITAPARMGNIMDALKTGMSSLGAYELRFSSLFELGRGYSFPCDEQGQVDIDALSERARSNYFFARTVIGREVATPAVRRTDLH